jgi:hypothetical protein
MTIFSYNLNTIVSSSLTVNCGSPEVVFITPLGFHIEIIFSFDNCVNFECSLIVHTDLEIYAGEYQIQYVFFFSGMPDTVIYSNVFIVIVINPCIPPPGCIDIPGCGIGPPTVIGPSVDIEIVITLTVDVVIDLPPWNCGTPGCDQ